VSDRNPFGAKKDDSKPAEEAPKVETKKISSLADRNPFGAKKDETNTQELGKSATSVSKKLDPPLSSTQETKKEPEAKTGTLSSVGKLNVSPFGAKKDTEAKDGDKIAPLNPPKVPEVAKASPFANNPFS